MKKFIRLAVVAVVALGVAVPEVFAAAQSAGPFTASASVSSGRTLSVILKKNSFSGATITNMDFGQLVPDGFSNLVSSASGTTGTGAVNAFITANSQGLPYTITQTGTPLSNGTTTLPTGALALVPVYAAADNGGLAQPVGSTLGPKASWVGNRTIYTSESGVAALRTIQAFYSVTADPAIGTAPFVPSTQQAGNYTGTVTITVTA